MWVPGVIPGLQRRNGPLQQNARKRRNLLEKADRSVIGLAPARGGQPCNLKAFLLFFAAGLAISAPKRARCRAVSVVSSPFRPFRAFSCSCGGNRDDADRHALVCAIPSRIAASSTSRSMLRSALNLMQYPVTLA